MRVPYEPPSKSTKIPYLQRGGELPGVQYGSGLFSNMFKAIKTVALPALKAVAKTALPMVKSAVTAGLAADGSIVDRLKAAGQSALTKENLMGLAQAGRRGAMIRNPSPGAVVGAVARRPRSGAVARRPRSGAVAKRPRRPKRPF